MIIFRIFRLPDILVDLSEARDEKEEGEMRGVSSGGEGCQSRGSVSGGRVHNDDSRR